MTSAKQKRAVGIFPDRPTTASALQALQDAGFSMRHVSVIAKDARKQMAIAGVRVRDRMGHRAKQGAIAVALLGSIAGSVTGLVVGLGTLVIPGVSPWLNSNPQLASATPTRIAATTVGGGIAGLAVGGALGALFGLGIPYDRAKGYRDRVEKGEYVLLLNSQEREFQRARAAILQLSNRDLEHESEAPSVPLLPPPSSPSLTDDSAPSPAIALPLEAEAVALSSLPSITIVPAESVSQSSEEKSASAVSSRQELPTSPIATSVAPIAPASPSSPPAPPPANRIPPPRPPAHIPPRLPKESQRTAPKSEKRAIVICPNAQAIERALSALRNAGFPMHRLSIMVPDPDHSANGADENKNTPDSKALFETALGGPFGSITGLMVGLQSLAVAGAGRFLVAGAEAPALTSALTGKAPTSLAGALMSIGVPEAEARLYSDRLTKSASLVMVRGTAEEALHLASTLTQHGMLDWSIYEIKQGIVR